uniref:NADH-quinone oxidoreductase subunit N n=1 Tax=uncultured Thiotrichaceae bacterium TaxID=298394 RepID=A0A6S6UGZ5_9GAMM|nr:MAG: NADH-ubiquinone oxidoreductase chain N (EC [uncultured Thiotrichaceae bacterium]
MNVDMAAFLNASPEVFLLGALCTVLLLDLWVAKESPLISYLATQVSLWATALLVYGNTFSRDEPMRGLGSMYIIDDIGGLLKIAILLISSLSFAYARKYLREQNMWRGEFFVLGMAAILGMMIMVSGYNLLVLYLGLELLALSMYALVAMQTESSRASEAAMKYFVLGAVASGLLLYGISMLYGMSGSLNIVAMNAYFQAQAGLHTNILFLFSMTFIVAGIAFKFGAVPFHMWLPDVYQGAPTAVTLFLGSAPKLAGLALLIRLLADGLDAGHSSWAQMLMLLGLLSVVIGNLIAIAQTSLKRMFAYSTIAHMGFVLLAVLAGNTEGYSAAVFYTIIYALMSAGGFAVLILLGNQSSDPDSLDCLRGLNDRSPWYAFIMLLLLFSMAGIPPTVGFYAKLSVINVVMGEGYLLVALTMVIMSVVGAFYYLRAIKLMYFDEPEESTPIVAEVDFQVLFSLNGLMMVALGIFPGALMGICFTAVSMSNL